MAACIVRGFTLMELIIVLLLIGLLASLATPRLVTMYDSVQIRYTRSDIVMQINGLSYYAFQQGKSLTLSHYPLTPIELSDPTLGLTELPLMLPPAWSLTTETPLVYQANGACQGGIAYLHYQRQARPVQTFPMRLSPPFCQIAL